MKIKGFLVLLFSAVGFIISVFTAVMTYIIIDEPIGIKMTSEIVITVFLTLPMIGLFSYGIGLFLSKKFQYIACRLDEINTSQFSQENHSDKISDITTIHNSIDELSNRLEKSIDQLSEHNQNLNSVIKSLSHDIKTPLSIIQGYLEEIEDGLVPKDELPKVLSVLKKEIEYIDEISSDVISYVQSQEFSEKQETILLKSFVHEEVCPLIKLKKEVVFQCDIPEALSLEFSPIALKKILINLLHNATKFTYEGSIRIKADTKRIIIEDTGIGIDRENAKTIFNPFVSLDESRNRMQNSGFGLGLSISRNLALSNNSNLFLDTEYCEGARFILSKEK